MLNTGDILETIKMIQEENLDIRTITMGISLLDCIDPDIDKACEKVYNKIVKCAKNLVKVGEDIGYSALVQKGFSSGDEELINSIPEALSKTQRVCSSVNIGSTKSGINFDACKLMGQVIRKTSELTADNNCLGSAKLVVFCNAPDDNPLWQELFMV